MPTLKTQSVSVWLCVLEHKREEGEVRERDAGWSFEIFVFLLQAAGRQFGWVEGGCVWRGGGVQSEQRKGSEVGEVRDEL